MCRIAGIYNPASQQLDREIIAMRDAMQHGGPDDAGVFMHPELPLALGHRRLSLIDLSYNGHQPMQDREAGLTLVFNGEIYNYRELRNTLQKKGHAFRTETDTEVILKAYLEWGTDAFELFNGMFALAIWDASQSQLVLARDHAGMKPLYYGLTENQFCFASEMRSFAYSGISFEERKDWEIAFLAFGYLPEPVTTLQEVVPLEKGTVMTVALPSLKIRKKKFFEWQLKGELQNEKEAIALLRETLEQSVERHLIADAPLGLFLSGGIDSSLLTVIAARYRKEQIKTLSIVFKEKVFSEDRFQSMIVRQTGTDHGAYEVSKEIFNNHLEDALLAMDQPSFDGINTYFISKYARAHGLKAVLSGVGADELFGGYPSFFKYRELQMLRKIPGRLLEGLHHFPDQRVRKITYAGMRHIVGEYLLMRGLFVTQNIAELLDCSQQEVEEVLEGISQSYETPNCSNGNRVSSLETNFYLLGQLLKDADCMSMWHGLEIRMPFLDKELMMMVGVIDEVIKFNPVRPKYLLLKAFEKDLPAEIWNRKKQGFTFPFEGWLKSNEYTLPSNAEEEKLYGKFQKGQLNWSRYWCAILMSRYAQKHKIAA
ncbi:MAG: asparagine synthase (glutamine-hydrolyzing) [Bacteroidetes bacterium]|nr:asparagine synthase (glutamine-hydrolyzing) [Bacteroidota bacterium]